MRKIENKDIEGNYVSNDIVFMQNQSQETEKIAVAYLRKNANTRQDNPEKQYYIVNVYNLEKKLLTKQSKSDVKKLAVDDNSDEYIWGGLQNGRIAIWDLRSQQAFPEVMSYV